MPSPVGELLSPSATAAPDASASVLDADMVICPGCCHQFRAVPINVQSDLAEGRAERDRWKLAADGCCEGCGQTLEAEAYCHACSHEHGRADLAPLNAEINRIMDLLLPPDPPEAA